MQHSVIAQRGNTLGARSTIDHRIAYGLVSGYQRLREGDFGNAWLYGFFLRAIARSMLRGWTEMPNSDSSCPASVRA
ncbi:hypothetical protein AWB68_08785 [Caballeronia choica]|uniref:Uncharacterized protein n=1 Tax=Caballeronia choica TaxID=326476 RepID=A0A158L529_9BURK|nr:hypothetical protein AWB68_08785 [Caballeronia choica]